MLNFLEKAGLVRSDPPAATGLAVDAAVAPPPVVVPAAVPAAVGSGVLDAEAVYAHAGVPPSVYPAERLLRLVDGLSAMEPATRLMAIQAMDAADESWSIADPLADATAKTQALAAHAQQLQANLQALEADTQAQLAAVASRQEQVVGDIRKQIAELEALVARELSRAAQESASHTAALSTATDQTRRELGDIAQLSQRLQSLSAQFGAPFNRPQE
ncbi:methyl-accepting chemotaxis protein [Rhodoferax sp.]|uniref:methyl-accepting chemotaxis protein n=1 Tax=Rhodoferax sp. TaxID=50421 RepID=UPI0025D3AF3C|nr:methyl-accepting chemotaxis protein [Rhodoferax sp.]